MKYKKIAFIGMMGSGKSTISRLLSEKINYKLIDIDFEFEKENNIKIKDFFKLFGEDEFRKKESELLKNFSKFENIIISTGGGIILNKENQNILFNQDILTIYLKTSSDIIYERIKNDFSRPLLQVENPKEKIKNILSKRETLYSKANITILTDNKKEDEIIEAIWKKLI